MVSTDYENSGWEVILPGSRAEPDPALWEELEDKGGAFVEVVKYARSERCSYLWTNDAFFLFRGVSKTRISAETIRTEPVQAALNILHAIKA